MNQMNSSILFVWIIGDVDARKYRVLREEENSITLQSTLSNFQSEEITISKEANRWKVKSYEAYPFIILFEKRSSPSPVFATAPPAPGTILVGDYFDGRSQYYSFWKVFKVTKAGNCQLDPLPVSKYPIQSDPGNKVELILPKDEAVPIDLEDNLATTTKNKKGELKVQRKYQLFYFDPERAYFYSWLSD